MKSPATDLDLNRVEKAFKKRIPGFRGPLDVSKTPQGQSNPTYIISSPSGNYVLRRKPNGVLLPSAHAVEREYRVMTALSDTELPVPQTIFLCEDPDEIGAVFFVMEHVPGRVFLDPRLHELTCQEREVVYDEMNLRLAQLHCLDPEKLGLRDYGKTGNYFARQFSRWSRQYDASATEQIAKMEELQNWLKNNLPGEEGPPRLVHGDWRIDNLIYEPLAPRLASIVDWELSTLGNPLADLGTQLMQWAMPVGDDTRGLGSIDRKSLGIPDNAAYVERYAQRAGMSEVPDLTFAVAFSFFRMGAIMQGIKKRVLDGNASNPERGLKIGKLIPLFAENAFEFINREKEPFTKK